jgi:hypothetical protein
MCYYPLWSKTDYARNNQDQTTSMTKCFTACETSISPYFGTECSNRKLCFYQKWTPKDMNGQILGIPPLWDTKREAIISCKTVHEKG